MHISMYSINGGYTHIFFLGYKMVLHEFWDNFTSGYNYNIIYWNADVIVIILNPLWRQTINIKYEIALFQYALLPRMLYWISNLPYYYNDKFNTKVSYFIAFIYSTFNASKRCCCFYVVLSKCSIIQKILISIHLIVIECILQYL